MKRHLILLLSAVCAVCLALALAGCNSGKNKEHVHDFGELIPEQPATCTDEGAKAHYYCEGCKKYFDEEKHETTPEELKIDIDPEAHKFGADGRCEYCGFEKPYKMGADGTTLYFGEYPQSEVEETGLKATLGMQAGGLPSADNANGWTDYNYYIEGEVQSYMWYIDVELTGQSEDFNGRYRGVYFTSYRPYWTTKESSAENGEQAENGYELNTAYWFKYEPIEWRILTQTDGAALLMSDLVLDGQHQYHDSSEIRTIDGKTIYPGNYKYSEMRTWLNETFYNAAFGEEAKKIIQTTEVDNSLKSTCGTAADYVCDNTLDNVFLLSREEAMNSEYGFSDMPQGDSARQLKCTAYAAAQGVGIASTLNKGYSEWWLRTPGEGYNSSVIYVTGDGYIMKNITVRYTSIGVAPALWIKL